MHTRRPPWSRTCLNTDLKHNSLGRCRRASCGRTTLTQKVVQMGPMSRDEKIMTAVMLGAVVLWVAGDTLGVASVVAAMLGLSALLLTGVLTWRDCLTYSQVLPTVCWTVPHPGCWLQQPGASRCLLASPVPQLFFSRGSINGLNGPVCPAAHKRADLAGLPHLQPMHSAVMGMLCLGAPNAPSARCHSIPRGLAPFLIK